ncbi:hypothetical protein Tco_1571068 [Tanacetum coccineum]
MVSWDVSLHLIALGDTSLSAFWHSTVTYTSVSFPVEDDSDMLIRFHHRLTTYLAPRFHHHLTTYLAPMFHHRLTTYLAPRFYHRLTTYLAPRSRSHLPHWTLFLSDVPCVHATERMMISPDEEQPLPAAASPTADSPGYVPESDLEEEPEEDNEDPEEDPADYPADKDDDDEDKDEDGEEEEEHPAPADSVPPPTHIEIPESYLLLRKRVRFASPTPSHEVGESLAVGAARQDGPAIARELDYGITDTWDDLRRYIMIWYYESNDRDREAKMAREAWGLSMDARDYARSDVMSLRTTVVAQSALYVMQPRNGDDSLLQDGVPERPDEVARGKKIAPTGLPKIAKPLNFKGTEGVVGLTQWFEKMESVYSISNCTVACQVKFATCTLQGNALIGDSHVKTTTPEAAYAMP